ncbi:DNA ligase D [Rummeliibacillus sp. JY-2-4R]
MKPMLLTQTDEIPVGEEWTYETKYDGFRCILNWEEEPVLISRNGKVLNPQFPEIIDYLQEKKELFSPYLPIQLDGELVFLINNFQSDFSQVQLRGRMRSQNSIEKHARAFPCHLIVFDVLQTNGKDLTSQPLTARKAKLQQFCKKVSLPTSVNYEEFHQIQMIDAFSNHKELWKNIQVCNGEGLIAKKANSKWVSDKRTTNWLKIKNWRYVTVILTKFDKNNGFFNGAVFNDDELIEVVSFKHGLKKEEFGTLTAFFEENGTMKKGEIYELQPSICVEIACIDFLGGMLREPRFHAFKLNVDPQECDWRHMLRQLQPLPKTFEITHPDKPVFPAMDILKDDFLYYLQNIAPLMLPFLRNRPLTLIRFPHGVPGESFYQKSSPEHVPEFITTVKNEDSSSIVCNNIETLLWLGNQLAIEYHIPFQPLQTDMPTEIVFDLDPPSVEEFSLSVEAAVQMKAIFDQFKLKSFIKTSGGKGMQIYIPLPFNTFSYEETGLFTKFVCDFLIEQNPQWFTIERLKKNRHNKLYLDYVQHREGKTIIAPYSTRGNDKGLVATPLNWNEVNNSLTPDQFSIPAVCERIKKHGNPFFQFTNAKTINEKSFTKILEQLEIID